jgi:hypothetical protein
VFKQSALSFPALVARCLTWIKVVPTAQNIIPSVCIGRFDGKKRVRSGTPGFRSQLNHRGRIMAYVLIVVSWLGGAVNGAAVSTQEFANVERCEAARLALVADAKARALEDQLRPICLQK